MVEIITSPFRRRANLFGFFMIASSIITICTDFLIEGPKRRIVYANLQSIFKAGRSPFRCPIVDSTHFVFSGLAPVDIVSVISQIAIDAPSLCSSKVIPHQGRTSRTLAAAAAAKPIALSTQIEFHNTAICAALEHTNSIDTPRLAPARAPQTVRLVPRTHAHTPARVIAREKGAP